jgi:CHAD domain-containing protein
VEAVTKLTDERDAAIRERNKARTEASHLRSHCAAYEAALGEDHADTARELSEAREALGNLRSIVAMLEAAREADRAMLCRILGCESEASMVVLLERVEALRWSS